MRNGSQGKPKGNQRETVTDLRGNQRETVTDLKGNQRETVTDLKGNQRETVTDLKGNRNGSQGKPKGNRRETVTDLRGNQRETKGKPNPNIILIFYDGWRGRAPNQQPESQELEMASKKDKFVTMGKTRCGHCEADHATLEVLEGEEIIVYCGTDCMRAHHRERSSISIHSEIGNMTTSMDMLKSSGHGKEYKAMWASRAALQAMLKRDEPTYQMYRKRGQELWCECLAECRTDGHSAITAEFMKLWYDLCDMCAPAFVAVPYDTMALGK